MSRGLLTILIFGLLTACSHDTKLTDQPRLKLTFDELPDTIQAIYISATDPKFMDNLNKDRSDIEPYKIVNLDSKVKKAVYEIKWLVTWVDEYKFHFDEKILTMDFNGNTINEPYVLQEHELYFVVTRSVGNKEDLLKAEFGKFDLKEFLQK
jgi:hypothetical protein